MKTFVLEKMPDLFWEEIKKKNYIKYFSQEHLDKKSTEIIIMRTATIADKNFIDSFPNLKLIIRAGTGFDNIDLNYAKSKNIAVQNTPKANAISAYEHTISIIFSLIKQLPTAKDNILKGLWKKDLNYNYEFSDIKALVVGVGRIGSLVAKTLKNFGAEVWGVDPYLSLHRWKELNIENISYQKGIQLANLITFHCPLTSKTKNYFSKQTLNLLKNPIFLINVARGGIVSEDAISLGFKRNLFLGVGLDVFTKEPWTIKKFAFQNNVILSPHIGAYTQKAKNRMALETINVWENYVINRKLTYQMLNYE